MRGSRGRWRRIVSSKHFRSSFFTILSVSTAVFLLAGIALSFQVASSLEKTAREEANRLSVALQEVFSTVKSNAVFIGSMRSVKGVLNMPRPGMDEYTGMAADLSVCANVAYYESVDVFMRDTRKVYVSQIGLYDFEDYPGADLIARIGREGAPVEEWLFDREYRRYTGDATRAVLTYLHRLPVYSLEGNGYVAVHMSYAALAKMIGENSVQDGRGVLVGFYDTLLYASDPGFSVGDDGFFPSAQRFARDSGGICAPSTSGTAVQCAYLLPRSAVWSALAPKIPQALLAFAGMALAVALCAFFYSALMLRPVEALARKAGAPGGAGDEFDLLNRVFDQMNGEIDGFRRQMERSLPLIQERIILELVSSYTEIADGRDDYADYGIRFPHGSFAVVIAVLPQLDEVGSNTVKEQLRLAVRQKSMERFRALGVTYSAYGESGSILFLINTDVQRGLEKRIGDICGSLASGPPAARAFPLLYAAGVCRKGERIPYRGYVQARRSLSYADPEGGGAAYASSPYEFTATVDGRAVKQLVRCVLGRDLPSLRGQLGAYFTKYLPPDAGGDEARKLSSALLCLVTASLIELDAPTDAARLAAAIRKVDAAEDADACAAILLAYFSASIGAHGRLPEESYAYVRDVAAFIEAHYGEDLTIPQIAGQVSLNPTYLNKLFKLSTGKTISEYLNFTRVEASKRLLRSGEDTVSAISGRIGYNDVRSFIRFFKKFNGVTPNDYRQQDPPPISDPAPPATGA